MSVTKTLSISALLAALAVMVAPAAIADDAGHGHMQMAQGGPGTMTPGQGMQGDRGPRADRAQRHEERRRAMAKRRIEFLDADRDGKLTAAEITGEQKRLFAAADVNGDGKLSVEEFRRRGRWFVRLGTMSFFDMLDANGDGQLSAEELNGPSERWFKRYDADKNGSLDADEYLRSRARAGGEGRGR